MFRDTRTLLILFGLPVVQILLFGFALSNEVKNSPMLVCDYAQDGVSRNLIDKFSANKSFNLEEVLLSHRELNDAFKKGRIKSALVFPPRFETELARFNEAELQFIVDASDPNTANILMTYAAGLVGDYQQSLLLDYSLPYSIQPEIRMLYNPELKPSFTFVPGLLALVLMLVSVMMTSVSIVREKEYGSMEVLLVSPVNPWMLIVAKIVPYLFLALINFITIMLLSITLLDLPVNGSALLLFAESMLFIVTALSLGILISNVAQTQQVAILISLAGLLLPTVLFTGFLFPIENMPLALRYFADLVPSRWYYLIVKSVMIKGLGLLAVWKETLILFLMTASLLFLSFRSFKVRLL